MPLLLQINMKTIFSIKILLVIVVTQITFQNATAQDNGQIVRLAKLIIDSAQLVVYKTLLKEEIETSLRVEPGVLTLYALYEKTILHTFPF